jgi:hypothetical protein
VTFGIPWGSSSPKKFPLTTKTVAMIAPFWADVDLTAGEGTVYYQEHYRDSDDLAIDPILPTDKVSLIFYKMSFNRVNQCWQKGFETHTPEKYS